MSRTTAMASETWDLGEMLAALCEVTQDAGDTESSPQAVKNNRIAAKLPATDEEESRP